MALLERQLPSRPSNSYFLQYASNKTSQGGEDGMLEELFKMLGIGPGSYCIDIGAWDGKHLSNTYTLLNERGWRGLLVEASSDRCKELSLLYADRGDEVVCLNRLVDLQGPDSLPAILEAHDAPLEPDFLSIDIDGADYHLWASLHPVGGAHRYRPKVVCIEFNPSMTNDILFVQAPSVLVHQGSSLRALVALGRRLGYGAVATTLFNAIFVRDDLLPLLPPLVDMDALHVPHMSTAMFQTYDGRLHYLGSRKLLWHRLPLQAEQLQVLSRRHQVYPFGPELSAGLQALLKGVQQQQMSEEVEEEVLRAIAMPSLQGIAYEQLTSLLHSLLSAPSGVAQQQLHRMAELLRRAGEQTLGQQGQGQGQGQGDPAQAERWYRLALLAAEEVERGVLRMRVSIGTGLARALRLQGRPLEGWQLLRKCLRGAAEGEEGIMMMAQKELSRCSRCCQMMMSSSSTGITEITGNG